MKKNYIIFMFTLLICSGAMAQNTESTRKSIEDAFISRMKTMAESDLLTSISCNELDTTVISKAEGKDYYIYPGYTYIFDEISSATYYVHKDTLFQPLCDKCFPTETIANRLLLPYKELPDGEMKITFQKYRYETDSVNIQFKQFVEFCNTEDYKMYVGIEQIDSIEMKVDVFLFNNISQWLHIFNLTCPLEDVADEGLSIMGSAWLFIPTSNLHELMGKKLPNDFMQKLLRGTKNNIQ